MDDESFTNNLQSSDFEIWDFPALSSGLHAQFDETQEISTTAQKTSEILEAEHQEVLQLKRMLQNNLMLLNNIHGKLQQTLEQVDEDFLADVVSTVKKITAKILVKTLSDEPTRLAAMIQEATAQIQLNKSCVILLCPEDYEILNNEDVGHIKDFLQSAPELKKGDFKVQMPTGEIVAVLEDRLKSFFEF